MSALAVEQVLAEVAAQLRLLEERGSTGRVEVHVKDGRVTGVGRKEPRSERPSTRV